MTPTPTAAAPTPPETGPRARIQPKNLQPLGEQLIIRTIPVNSVGSILLPDSAIGISLIGEKGGADDSVHFVEAEVIAVGPGKRRKGDPRLVEDLTNALTDFVTGLAPDSAYLKHLVARAQDIKQRIPPLVKPGDRILYHPSVQRFDRDITDLLKTEEDGPGVKYFMIREDSVLAVIERE